ncbi:hypothetical protein [Henriciella aquimarina]|uniref:hypothetical protein n=1 Tax=Henriciella aquimarina TaxID=545261 RepID=UPI000A02FBC6|nr:hypothetical protein [Henriciella aquimarina]
MRLTVLDESHAGDHFYIRPEDNCAFLREYTRGRGFEFSATNSLISNLKKPMDRKGRPEWRHKERAIRQAAAELKGAIHPDWLARAVLVPIPPSKSKDNPLHDDRVHKICEHVAPGGGVRDLVIQTQSTRASHESDEGERVTVEELLEVYRIDESLATPAPQTIGIVDDVLTAGTHFRAMSDTLSQRFPDIPIFGLFIARRVFPDVSFEDFGFGPLEDE